MPSFNKVILCGNLTRDPELKYLPSNTPVAEFGLACNRKFKKQDGQTGEEVLFIDCVAFARLAEIVNEYASKGDPILVEGRLRLDQWDDKDGNKRSKHRVAVESVQLLGSRGESERPAKPNSIPGVRGKPAADIGATYDNPASDLPF